VRQREREREREIRDSHKHTGIHRLQFITVLAQLIMAPSCSFGGRILRPPDAITASSKLLQRRPVVEVNGRDLWHSPATIGKAESHTDAPIRSTSWFVNLHAYYDESRLLATQRPRAAAILTSRRQYSGIISTIMRSIYKSMLFITLLPSAAKLHRHRPISSSQKLIHMVAISFVRKSDLVKQTGTR